MSQYKERPCAGCGKIGRRRADTLCLDCSVKLQDYNRMSELYSRAFGEQALVDCGYCNKVPLPLARGIHSGSLATENFREALTMLIDGLTPIAKGSQGRILSSNVSHDGPGPYCNHIPTHSFKAYDTFPSRFGDFLAAIRILANDIFSQGQKSGQNLLMQLNEGNISTKDFEERRDRN